MTKSKSSSPPKNSAPPVVVRPPITDRSPLAGLPASARGGVDTAGGGAWSRAAQNEIARGAVRRFGEALGETNPIYFDADAAKAQGYRDMVAPLAFPFSLRSTLALQEVAPSHRTVLSSDQQIESFETICAGDKILVSSRIAELTQRPGNTGPLEFVVIEDEGRSPEGKLIYRTRRTLIVRAGREQSSAGGA